MDDLVVECIDKLIHGLLNRHVGAHDACRKIDNALDTIRGFLGTGLAANENALV